MLRAFLLCYIGRSIDAGFLYYAAAVILCIAEVVNAWLSERDK